MREAKEEYDAFQAGMKDKARAMFGSTLPRVEL